MAFDPAGETSAEWAPFGRYRFTLPRFQLENHGSHSYLVCNVLLRSCDDCAREPVDVLNDLETITFPASVPRPQTPRAADRTDYPDEQQWNEGVSEALGAIREGRFDKVVLARRSVFAFDQPVDPLSLLARIVAPAAATYQFCFQPEPGAAFLGATPERLYGRRGRYIESEALASTRPRGADDAEDEALAAELRESDKDRREHAFVVKAIREALEGLCRNVYVSPDVSVLKLPGCQHLQCPLEGILREIPSDAAVINALHPSPAVGGAPRAEALDFIRAHESFDRGWYAGPAGWIGPDSGEFAVAIRSGLVHDNSLSLYSGAGIVDGSTPEGEWKEIDTKLSNALRALTGHDD
jgi:menaquinone-specific isochorismate synthase